MMTDRLKTVLAVTSIGVAMATASATPDPVIESQVVVRYVVHEEEAEEIAQLQAQNEELLISLKTMSEHRENVRAWKDRIQGDLYVARREIRKLEQQIPPTLTLAEQDEMWRAGYVAFGGQRWPDFRDTILPCESGNGPNAHDAVGDLDRGTSLGRGQIHRPSWRHAFNSGSGLQRVDFAGFGIEFDDWITTPWFNGAMSGIIENEHPTGLNAWTCWRLR